jgi:hypothetical protein
MGDKGPNPMEILQRISPAGAHTYMEHRAAIMENPDLAALPPKIKLDLTDDGLPGNAS